MLLLTKRLLAHLGSVVVLMCYSISMPQVTMPGATHTQIPGMWLLGQANDLEYNAPMYQAGLDTPCVSQALVKFGAPDKPHLTQVFG